MTTITIDRAVVQQALEALEAGLDVNPILAGEAEEALRAALAQQAEPVAWRCACGANLYLDEYGHPASRAAPRYGKPQQAEPVQEPVAWECKAGGLKALTQRQYDAQPLNIKLHYTRIAAPQRHLADDEIGRLWFEAKIPGLTETSARLLIRAAEKMLAAGAPKENPSFG